MNEQIEILEVLREARRKIEQDRWEKFNELSRTHQGQMHVHECFSIKPVPLQTTNSV
jgi:hypothetical protein